MQQSNRPTLSPDQTASAAPPTPPAGGEPPDELSADDLQAQGAVELPAREALTLVTPVPGGAEGAGTALEAVPDGAGGETAIGDHAPVYTIQPVAPAEEI